MLAITTLFGQTVFYTESFEGTTGYTFPNGSGVGTSTEDFFDRTDSANAPGQEIFTYNSFDGAYFIAGEDIDGVLSTSTGQVYLDNINISGQSSLSLTAAFASGTDIDIDEAFDRIWVEVKIDGGSWVTIGSFEGDSSTYSSSSGPFNGQFAEDTNGDGNGDGTQLTGTFTDFTWAIAGTGDSLDVRISMDLQSGDEEGAFDNVRISGISAGPVCNSPSSISATVTATTADLSWMNGSGNMYSNVEWGMAGFNQGSGTFVASFNQASGSLNLTGLMAGSSYDVYVQDSCGTIPGTVSAWVGPFTFNTIAPEPTTHVTMFTAVADLNSMVLLWIDADTSLGAQAPDGYVVLGSTGGKMNAMPVDGTPISNDLSFSDSLYAINVMHINDTNGTLISGLMPNTSYSFEIYPYTNTGSAVDYLTTPAAPSIMASTKSIPTYQIGTVTTNDMNFVPDSIGVYCKLVGVVTSFDFDGNAGYNFTIQDSTGGAYVYNFADKNGYQSTQGDEIRVVGNISQFNGLTQFFVDSITLLSSGNPLPVAPSVTMLDESTENELVMIEGAYLADPGQWPTFNTSRNIDIVTPLGDTLTMRIDFDTRIFDSLFVSGIDTFTVTGVGGQFDNSAPYNSGYQIFPSFDEDIMITGSAQCGNPFGLGAMVTDTSATLMWMNGPNNMYSNIEWGVAGFSQGSGSLIMGFNQGSGSLMLNGLTTGTSYDFYVQDSCATIGGFSMWVGPFTFTPVAAPLIPLYQIGTVTTSDTLGLPDSLGTYCALRGIVTTIDFDGNNGFSFYMQDPTGGINIFNFNDVSNYVVTQGDELEVYGDIQFFNGLTELFVDSIKVLSQGNMIPAPKAVTAYDEVDEGSLLSIENAMLISSWPAPGSGSSNLNLVTPLGDTLVIRIDSDTRIFDSIVVTSTDTITVRGALTQFDNSSPYFDGYQILPSVDEDFMIKPAILANCNIPTNLSAAPMATEASLSWTTGGSNMWNIEWGTTGFAQGSGSTIKGVNTNPFNLTGLMSSTSYDFYVQDSCGTLNSSSAWAGPFTFMTTMPMAIPTYDIATITTVDANGEPDSLNVYCKVIGTVFTPDYDGNNGYSFYVQDGTGGINIFNFTDLPSGYQSQKGDEIRATGTILFFNGLIEIQVDSIVVISQGNSVGSPAVVTSFDATTVNEFIKIEKVKIVDPTQWPAPGDNANLDIATATGDTLVMRIDKDVFIQDTMATAPTGFVDVTGVGGQFDSQAPYFDGYQIFPRRYTDIVDVDPCPAPTGLTAGNFTKNSADLSWTSANSGAVFNIVWGKAGFLFSQGNVVSGITTNSFTLTGLDNDEMYEFFVQDSCGSFLGNSQFVGPESFSTLVDNVTDLSRVSVPLMAFPNPANQAVVMLNKVGNFTIFDVLGQEVSRVVNNNRFDATNFNTGIYLVKATNGETIRVIIK